MVKGRVIRVNSSAYIEDTGKGLQVDDVRYRYSFQADNGEIFPADEFELSEEHNESI